MDEFLFKVSAIYFGGFSSRLPGLTGDAEYKIFIITGGDGLNGGKARSIPMFVSRWPRLRALRA